MSDNMNMGIKFIKASYYGDEVKIPLNRIASISKTRYACNDVVEATDVDGRSYILEPFGYNSPYEKTMRYLENPGEFENEF